MSKKKKINVSDRQAAREWEEYVKSIARATAVEEDLSVSEREKKKKYLEAHPIKWMMFFFCDYAKAEFAGFQRKAINRILGNPEWFEVLSWARELAKSTIVMMCVMYLVLTGKKKNVLLVAATLEDAIRLLKPYKGAFEGNQRIKLYYGEQQSFGDWTEKEFITKNGAAFRALGAGQSPRGTRNEDVRPDVILIDDFDTDEACRNPETLKNNWNWLEQALYFVRSFSEPLLRIFCGNIIAKDCCVKRAGMKAREMSKREKPLGNWDVINIRMVNINKPDPKRDYEYGTSVWPEKNSEEIIDTVICQVSAASAQKECFNNPVSEGDTFKELIYGKVPSLHKFPFLVNYGDPSPSNNTKASKNSLKANWLLGLLNGKLYVIKGYLGRVTNEEFVNRYYYLDEYVDGRTNIYHVIENNKLQDPFYQQLIVPLFTKAAIEKKKVIPITPDTRKKPDKYSRIETNLEPLNRKGDMILNVDEKENPDMQRLEEQFLLVNPSLTAPADGPDCVEGGYWYANTQTARRAVEDVWVPKKTTNSKRI